MKSKWKKLRCIPVLLFFCTVHGAFGQTKVAPADSNLVISVQFILSKEVNQRLLSRDLGFDIASPIESTAPDSLIEAVVHSLNRQGYYLARVDTVVEQPADSLRNQHIYIFSGVKYSQFNVRYHVPDSIKADVVFPGNGSTVSTDRFETNLKNILDGLANTGYAFATFQLDTIQVLSDENRTLSISASLDPGPLVRIDSILVTGNTLTKEYVVLRELPIRKGMIFRKNLVDKIPARLMRTGIFASVSDPELLIYKEKYAALRINVMEGKTNHFSGVAGYNPGTENASGYLTGTLDLQFGNLLGTGREINARWEKKSRNAQELAFRYREPWLFSRPLHAEGGFQQLIQDTLYVEQEMDVALSWAFGLGAEIMAVLKRSTVAPDSFGIVLFGIEKSEALANGLGLRFNTLDHLQNPRSGVVYYNLFETIYKSVTNHVDSTKSDFKQQKISVDLEWYISPFQLQVLGLGMHWRYISSNESEIAFADEFRLGGAKTMRGYREEQFRGSRVAWANFEYRYILGRRSRAFLFYDVGYYFQNRDGIVEEVLSSFGVGARIDTQLGVMGVDYGLGEGDGLSEGKIHVHLLNSF